jgi:hypothetical protein
VQLRDPATLTLVQKSQRHPEKVVEAVVERVVAVVVARGAAQALVPLSWRGHNVAVVTVSLLSAVCAKDS